MATSRVRKRRPWDRLSIDTGDARRMRLVGTSDRKRLRPQSRTAEAPGKYRIPHCEQLEHRLLLTVSGRDDFANCPDFAGFDIGWTWVDDTSDATRIRE